MDIGTLVGIIAGMVLVIGSIIIGGGAGFLNLPSLLITIGGAFAATLINFPLPKIIGTIRVARKAFTNRTEDQIAMFKLLSDFAVRARRDGILGLEADVDRLEDPFMKKGMQMGVDGNPAEIIEAVLEQDIASMV
jgi:chemotaxis protein MotA